MDDIKSQFRRDIFQEFTVRTIREGNDTLDGFPSHLTISDDWSCILHCVMYDSIVQLQPMVSF